MTDERYRMDLEKARAIAREALAEQEQRHYMIAWAHLKELVSLLTKMEAAKAASEDTGIHTLVGPGPEDSGIGTRERRP